ncbi:hypothetical protein Btru_070117 [Bulinus truncatus]|nr:hypothetical protein Btru_070117 [Bulinus truncatus]
MDSHSWQIYQSLARDQLSLLVGPRYATHDLFMLFPFRLVGYGYAFGTGIRFRFCKSVQNSFKMMAVSFVVCHTLYKLQICTSSARDAAIVAGDSAIFDCLAFLLLPTLTTYAVSGMVRSYIKQRKNYSKSLLHWAPIVASMCIIPAVAYPLDAFVERIMNTSFRTVTIDGLELNTSSFMAVCRGNTTFTWTSCYSQMTASYSQLTSCYSQLTSCYSQLTSCYSQLTSCYSQLTSCYSQLTSCYSQLTSRCSQLTSRCSQLTSRYSQLTSCYSQLTSCYSQLTSCYSQLTSRCPQLTSCYSQLTSRCSQLTSCYSQLTSRYSQTQSTLNTSTRQLSAACFYSSVKGGFILLP